MTRNVLSAAALVALLTATSAPAQEAVAPGPSQDAAWHNRQMLALAERVG